MFGGKEKLISVPEAKTLQKPRLKIPAGSAPMSERRATGRATHQTELLGYEAEMHRLLQQRRRDQVNAIEAFFHRHGY
jgi:hypothetical protein